MTLGYLLPIDSKKLSGGLDSYYSIRINKQWRIIFFWENDNALEVEIVDYH